MGIKTACMPAHHICAVPQMARRESQIPRDWVRQLLVSLYVGTERTQTQILWKSRQCSELLSHLSSPSLFYLYLCVYVYISIFYVSVGILGDQLEVIHQTWVLGTKLQPSARVVSTLPS